MSSFCPVQINFSGGNEKLKAIKMRCCVYTVLNHSYCENLVFTSWRYYRYVANFCFYSKVQGQEGLLDHVVWPLLNHKPLSCIYLCYQVQ